MMHEAGTQCDCDVCFYGPEIRGSEEELRRFQEASDAWVSDLTVADRLAAGGASKFITVCLQADDGWLPYLGAEQGGCSVSSVARMLRLRSAPFGFALAAVRALRYVVDSFSEFGPDDWEDVPAEAHATGTGGVLNPGGSMSRPAAKDKLRSALLEFFGADGFSVVTSLLQRYSAPAEPTAGAHAETAPRVTAAEAVMMQEEVFRLLHCMLSLVDADFAVLMARDAAIAPLADAVLHYGHHRAAVRWATMLIASFTEPDALQKRGVSTASIPAVTAAATRIAVPLVAVVRRLSPVTDTESLVDAASCLSALLGCSSDAAAALMRNGLAAAAVETLHRLADCDTISDSTLVEAVCSLAWEAEERGCGTELVVAGVVPAVTKLLERCMHSAESHIRSATADADGDADADAMSAVAHCLFTMVELAEHPVTASAFVDCGALRLVVAALRASVKPVLSEDAADRACSLLSSLVAADERAREHVVHSDVPALAIEMLMSESPAVSSDSDCVMAACNLLHRLAEAYDECAILARLGAGAAAIRLARKLIAAPARDSDVDGATATALNLLEALGRHNDVRVLLMREGVVPVVVAALERFAGCCATALDDPGASSAWQVICLVASLATDCEEYALALVQAGILPLLLRLLKAQGDNDSFVEKGCTALGGFARFKSTRAAVFNSEAVKVTRRAIMQSDNYLHLQPARAWAAFLAALSAGDAEAAAPALTPTAKAALATCPMLYLMAALDQHGGDAEFVASVCSIMRSIAPVGRTAAHLTSLGAVKVAAMLMRSQIANERVVEPAAVALRTMTDCCTDVTRPALQVAGALPVLIAVLRRHSTNKAIVASVCGTLRNAAACTGDRELLRRLGAVAALQGAVVEHAEDADIAASVREAVALLTPSPGPAAAGASASSSSDSRSGRR